MVTTPPSASWATQLVLRDGTQMLMRRVHPCDETGLFELLTLLSPKSIYLRFCSGGANLRAAVLDFTRASDERIGVVACDVTGEIVAHAEYVLTSRSEAEVAVVVADRLQGRGLAREMLEWLAADAGARGIERFIASVLPSNASMLRLFKHAFYARVLEEWPVCELWFPTSISARERRARPRTVQMRSRRDAHESAPTAPLPAAHAA